MLNVWRLVPHHSDRDAAIIWTAKHNKIAIGWGQVGDLKDMQPESAEDITAAIRAAYPKIPNSKHGGDSLWRLYHEMKEDDLVIIRAGTGHDVVAEVVSDYFWTPDEGGQRAGYQHMRAIEITEYDPAKVEARGKLKGNATPRQNTYDSLVLIGTIETPAGLSR